MNYELRDYQKQSRINFFATKRKLLHYTVAGGKTLTALDIINSLEIIGAVESTLIIAPLTVSKQVWEQEIKKFGFSLSCTNLSGMAVTDGIELTITNIKNNTTSKITIINKDKLTNFLWGRTTKIENRTVRLQKGVCNYPAFKGYDMIIVDESTMFKRKSKRTTAFLKFLRMYNPEYRLLLTGTPWTNDGANIYWQYRLLFEGDPNLKYPLGTSQTDFRNKYYNAHVISNGGHNTKGKRNTRTEYELRDKSKEIMAYLLAPFTDVITIEEVRKSVSKDQRLGIAKPKISNKIIELPKNLKKEYNKLKKSEVISISNELDISIETDEELVFQMGNGNKGNKLRQLLSGFVYYNYEDAIVNDMPIEESELGNYKKSYFIKPILDIKLKAINDIIEERKDENILLLFHFEAERQYLLNHFSNAVLLNSATIDDVVPRWNNGEIKLMIANPASVSHGLNLQHGGKTWVWYTPTYNLEHWLQANGRLPRPNQKYQTEMIQIKFKDTIDEVVYDSIENNTTESDEWTYLIKQETMKLTKALNYESLCV